MAYDSTQGFYYNFFINGKEQDFNPSFLNEPTFYHSIFDLIPTAALILVNQQNSLYQLGFGNPINSFSVEMGTKEDDEDMDRFYNLIVEKMQIVEAKPNLEGTLVIKLINSSLSGLRNKSPAKGWYNKSTSKIIEDIVKPYVTDRKIDSTVTKGIWLKPNNQTEEEFLHIIKNRSLPITSVASKMFMWIDLEGIFHFQSIDSMLSKKIVEVLDFTESDTDIYAPTDFDYIDNGLRYNPEDTNENFVEYPFDKDGAGTLSKIDRPNIKKIDTSAAVGTLDQQSSFLYNQPILQGYTHDLLPKDYNKAIYYNNTYNFPYRFSFTIKNRPKIKPGTLIGLIFPNHAEEEDYDRSLSGTYLVIAVRKREIGLQYVNDIYVVSNSQVQPIPAI